VREWLLTFPFPPIPIYSIPIPPVPIPIYAAVQCLLLLYYCSLLYGCYIIIDTVQKSWSFIITVLKTFSVGFSFILQIQALGTFSVINYAKRKRTPLSVQSLKSVSCLCFILLWRNSNEFRSKKKYVGINSHGSAGNSHSHWGGFPFPPIPIPNFVFCSHSHGIPIGFPFPLGIPFLCTSLIQTQIGLLHRSENWWKVDFKSKVGCISAKPLQVVLVSKSSTSSRL